MAGSKVWATAFLSFAIAALLSAPVTAGSVPTVIPPRSQTLSPGPHLLTVSNPYADKAFDHIYEAMDRYHLTFDVYTDNDAGGNHYVPSGWYNGNSNMTFDPRWTDNPQSGATSIKVTWNGAAGNDGWKWNGIVFQEPENNWQGGSGGYDLSGATKLTFWARTDEPGLKVKFLMGLPGDTSGEVSLGFVPLSTVWTKYEIQLESKQMDNIVGGFGFVFNDVNDPDPDGTTFYLDDIQYDKVRPDDLRFMPSFVTTQAPEDQYIRNAAFIYDNALALIAMVARGTPEDMRRARILADSFIYAMEHDRSFTDGRLRNAYQAGDLADRSGEARLPGWLDAQAGEWLEDEDQVSTYTGNIAWVTIALLSYYEHDRVAKYKEAAIRLGDWIYDNSYDGGGIAGYTGGYQGWEPQPSKLLWKSTEHNIDVYAAFTRLYEVTNDSKWRDGASQARSFVEAMWDEAEGHFWIGTLDDGITINNSVLVTDVNTWAILALEDADKYRSLDWVEGNTYVQCPSDGFKGFDFNNDKDGVWFEGTAHAIVAFQATGQKDKADAFLAELRKAQQSATNTDGKGLVAACPDGVSTGLHWRYYTRLHIGATSWFVLAELGFNPFWGKPSTKTVELSHQLSSGWNMFSLPLDIDPADWASQLGDDFSPLYVYHYDPVSHGYQMYPSTAFAAQRGWGYWIKALAVTDVDVEGTIAAATPYSIHLLPGWMQIGHPFDFPVSWSEVQVRNTATGEVVSIEQAHLNGWVQKYLYSYDPGIGGYHMDAAPGGVLTPWLGYWVKTLVEADLIIPNTPMP